MENTNYTPNPNGGVALGLVFSTKTGEIVLVKNINHRKPKWKMPGGTIETHRNESPKNAFIREVFEETGLRLKESGITLLMRVLSSNERSHYYHVFVGVVDDFTMLNKSPISEKDSSAILVADKFTIEETVTPGVLLQQHFMLFKEALKETEKMLCI